MPDDQPLHGIRVIDLGQYIAGPSVAQTLSDLGADVIKVESPGGDQARSVGPFGEAMVRAYNRDKRSIALNLRAGEGRDILHRLIADADVLVGNFRHGSADRLGIGPQTLSEKYPRLVHASITGFGTGGPSSARPGLDIAAQAEFGLMHMTGAGDGEPQRVGAAVADVSAANAVVHGILAALFRRERTGRGGHVESSLMEATLAVQAAVWGEYQLTGKAPRRRGNGQANAAPAADVVEVADGHIVVSAYASAKWLALCRLIGRPDLATDPRFLDNPSRVANRPALLAVLAEAFSSLTRAQAVAMLDSAGIVCGAVRAYDEIDRDEDVEASGILVQVADPGGEDYRVPGQAFTVDGARRHASAAAPVVGAHTVEILTDLGYSPDAIDAMYTRGAVAGVRRHEPIPRKVAL